MRGTFLVYVEVLIEVMVMVLVVLMYSYLGFVMDVIWVLLVAPFMIQELENLWVHC